MHKIFAFLLFACCEISVCAQLSSISGKITDKDNGQSVTGASVFLSNTSYGCISTNTGAFEIDNIKPGKYDLVVSFVGYETYTASIQMPSDGKPLNISIKQKAKELDAVIVRNYLKNGWEEWGNFFLGSFIGESALANQCTLKNKNALRFSFSKKENMLMVIATEPLIIENKALGYHIQYQLEDFRYWFDDHFLFYAGYPLLTEMQAGKAKQKKWQQAREEVYETSMMRFMRSLYRNRLAQDGYQLLFLKRTPNTERQRWVAKQKLYYDTVNHNKTIPNFENTLPADSLTLFEKYMHQQDPIQTILTDSVTGNEIAYAADSITAALDFSNYLIVRFPQKTIPAEYANSIKEGSIKQPITSIMTLVHNKPVYVTYTGYYYEVQDLVIEGYWAWWEKISSLLPLDYVPVKK